MSTVVTPSRILRLSRLPMGSAALLARCVQLGLLTNGERDKFLAERIDRLPEYDSDERLGAALHQSGLMTSYQVDRVIKGQTHGLTLGNYRVLEILGQGGMGTVYLAEHRLMRRRVAVKVVICDEELHHSVRDRFYSEMRVLSELSHPNVVLALDAGEVAGEGRSPPLVYMVLELVEGGDLDRVVARQGVCGVVQACNYVRQAAAGLQAAHDRHLVHRDLKPSNLLLDKSGQVKLVDFGLARQFSSKLTDPRALLGSLEFMPPEQTHDPSSVGPLADIYGLGATLFWLLTGEGPYPHTPHAGRALRQVQTQPPRRLRELRRDAPAALDELVARMLAREPNDRVPSALAVMNALRPFLFDAVPGRVGTSSGDVVLPRALVVGDTSLRPVLEQAGFECGEAADGRAAIDAAARGRYDVVLLDGTLPGVGEVCRLVRDRTDEQHLKVLVVSASGREVPGADDVAAPGQLLARARQALELKSAQDRAARLTDQLLAAGQNYEQSQQARHVALHAAHDALLFALAKIAESRDGETTGHLERMKAYSRARALEAAKAPPWQGLVDERFLRQLERCVPLHDIGKLGLSDEIFSKPASLTPDERERVQQHPVIGDEILDALAEAHGAGLDFLGTARSIVRHHHERWDGTGYPDRLIGDDIPAVARLVAVADVYDALRRMRLYKPAMPHAQAISLMLTRSPGQFDPTLAAALGRCQGEFERIYREIED